MEAQIKNIHAGSIVRLDTLKESLEGTILKSADPEIILFKLSSGYNIGIPKKDIKNIKVLKKPKIEEEKAPKLKIKRELPNVALIVTGGTISSRLDYSTGGVKWLTNPAELLKFYPELLDICNIIKIEVPFMTSSEDMTSKEWQKIAETTHKLISDKNISGVIITHGTDFLHYTAAALSFFIKDLNKPVALTYSQRSSDRASSDASLNLICAARAAVSEIAEVILVGHANTEDNYCYALLGSKVRKMHSSRRDTFRPINTKPLAKIFPDKPEIEKISEYNLRDERKKPILDNKFNDKVALIKFYPGQTPDILDFYKEKGYKGIVIEASGLGHLPSQDVAHSWLAKISKIIKSGMVVCAAPQTLYGRLDPLVYSPGRKLLETGVIFLEDMLPETALVKLGWVIAKTQGKDKEKIKELMLTNINKEFNKRLNMEFLE